MRGQSEKQREIFVAFDPERVIGQDNPIRRIKAMADEALRGMSPVFDQMYGKTGRPSVPPERLLKSLLLIALYSVRSERQFCEQLGYNFLYRWFLDMGLDEKPFDATSFSQNRERLLEHEVAERFFNAVIEQARSRKLLSEEHFTVDGTLIEAMASLKSFRRKDGQGQPPADDDPGNPEVDFHGEKRSNATHESATDPQARLARKGKGKEARLAFSAHALMENRHGLVLDFRLDTADGKAERRAAVAMIGRRLKRGATLGADKGYDTADFVKDCRARGIVPHVAAKKRGSAVDGRTTRHAGYAVSQRKRKRVEEIFGWMKTIGGFRRTRFVGLQRTQLAGWFVAAAYNLVRMSNL